MILAALGAVALGASACDGGVEVPAGFVEAEAGPVRFAHPEDWTEADAADRIEGAIAQFQTPTEGDATPAGILVFASPATEAEFEGLVRNDKTSYSNTFSDFDMVDETDIEVAGAEEAVLLEYTYSTDAGENAHSYDVLTVTAEDEAVFRVAGPEDLLDEDLARQIIDTLSFE